jgi:hypothetical protein
MSLDLVLFTALKLVLTTKVDSSLVGIILFCISDVEVSADTEFIAQVMSGTFPGDKTPL